MVAAVDDPYQRGATRTELTLGRIGQAWSSRLRGSRFVRALSGFISSGGSRHTTRTYAYAVIGLWEWLDSQGRGLPVPDELSRQDAVEYDRWLRESGENLTRYRLAADPTRLVDLAIYDYVVANPLCKIDSIRQHLVALGKFNVASGKLYIDLRCQGELHRYLGSLVIGKVLRRSPTVEEVRRMAESRRFVSSDAVQGVFEYEIDDHARATDDRVCGNATRIGVLAAFWSYMASQGENIPGSEEPLLRFNIWDPVLRRVREQTASRQADRRIVKTPDGGMFARVLATTFVSSHGERSLEAAEAAIRGEVIPSTRGKFADLRDRALLLVMLQAGGPRASEVQNMRRQDISDDLSQLTIHGKRNKVRTVPVPPAAADAIARMTGRISSLVSRRKSQGRDSTVFEQLLFPDAPLLPAIRYWGANRDADASCGLTRAGIAMRLRHLATAAGFKPGSPEFAMMHPHGIRRLFAKQHMAMGTPLNVLQSLMGHASGATTLRYAEEKDVAALRTAAFGAAGPAMRPAQPAEPIEALEPPRAAERPPEPRRPEMVAVPAPQLVRVVREQPKPSRKLPAPKQEPETVAEACKAITSVGAFRTLCDVYESAWGEKGDRTRIQYGGGLSEREGEAAVATQMMPVEVVGPELTSFGETRRLEHTYCGRKTGLVWWAGTIGYLRPEMPVASVRQLGEQCGPETRSSLCQSLVALWSEWNDDDSKGPTAAGALGMWVAEFLETAAQVDGEITSREGFWVEHEVPIEETVLGGTKRYPEARTVFREHDETRIIKWFREVAWQYRVSAARPVGKEESAMAAEMPSKRPTKVIDTPFDVPAWYALEDPLADMSAPERDEALDLIAVLTRGVLLSRVPRWGALSRRTCSDLIQSMMRYDEALDDLRRLRNESSAGEGASKAVADQKRRVAELGVAANTLFRSVGAPVDFDLVKLTSSRMKVQKYAAKGRRRLWAFRLDVIRSTFGDAPADDAFVQLVARHSGDAPLGSGDSKDLLDPNWEAGTIRHTSEFIKKWAKEYGTYSECVARRLARHMYELFVAARGKGPFARRDELVNYVSSMSAYRVPCPASCERKLRGLFLEFERPKMPIYEKWRSAFGVRAEPPKELPEPKPEEELATAPAWSVLEEEEQRGFAEGEVEELLAEYGSGIYERNPHSLSRAKARSAMPHPLLTLLLLLPFIPP